MMLTPEIVTDVLNGFWSRCAEARMAGIPLYEVVDHIRAVPDGWWFDHDTAYYLPPGFQFSSGSAN